MVDRGLVSLDDPTDVNKHLPELCEFQIVKGYTDEGDAILEDQAAKGTITLRMLLSHTSGKPTSALHGRFADRSMPGLSYVRGDPLQRWMSDHAKRPFGFLAPDASLDDYTYPLVFHPGTDWQYGFGLDWAAFLLERVTGENIKEYYRKNIFEPCGMTSTGFLPTAAVKEKLMRMTYYDDDHIPRAFANSFTDGSLPRPEEADSMGPVFSGGAGLFGTARDYLAFLRGVLASSSRLRSAETMTKPLLSDASFEELFRDVVSPEGKRSLMETMKRQTYHAPELFEDESGKDIGHSVGLCLNLRDSSFGRKAGSGCCESTEALTRALTKLYDSQGTAPPRHNTGSTRRRALL